MAHVIDWEGVERDYRAGIKSVREIAATYGCSHTIINKRAATYGWARDLGGKIRAKADALVAKEAVSRMVSTETRIPEREIVEANAVVQANIRREHRSDIQRTKRVANTLIEKLERRVEALASTGDKFDDLREQASTLKLLADTQRTVITLEKEAFGMTTVAQAETNDPASRIDPLEGARHVAFLLARAQAAIKAKKETEGA